jgi:NADH dehydrogenase
VDDVAEAIVRGLDARLAGSICELGGPRVFTYAELLRTIADRLGTHPLLIPLPFAAWRALGFAAEILPRPPVTRNQVELMMIDSVVSPGLPGFASLDIKPRGIEETLEAVVRRGR